MTHDHVPAFSDAAGPAAPPEMSPSVQTEAVPAATVILVRDGPSGLEALTVRRNSRLAFGGMWVFPGGRVDPADCAGGVDELAAARRAGAREVAEEAGLGVDVAALIPYSHWTPPASAPKRFATWFFVARAPEGAVTVDGGEIKAYQWITPRNALSRHRAGEIELAPPTWITLATLSLHPDSASLLVWARQHEPSIYATRIAVVAGDALALYVGDAGYEDGDAKRAGRRHRLSMGKGGWSYERPDGTVIES